MEPTMLVTHAFQPVYDSRSRILVLGTMPSPQSVRNGFYYSHPQNRFWPLLSALLNEPLPHTPEEKAALVLKHGIALWDVLAECEIKGASDASIRKPVPNDFTRILGSTRIDSIYTTGKTAYKLFQKHVAPIIGRNAVCLPSTSPANQALFPWEKLFETWKQLLDLNCYIKR